MVSKQNKQESLLFLIDKSAPVFEDHPLALFLAQDDLFPAGDDCLYSSQYFSGYHNVALISLRSPFNRIIGVSVHAGRNPPTSPYPP